MRSWWQTYRRGRAASRSRFSSKQSKERQAEAPPGSAEEALPQAVPMAQYYYAGPDPPVAAQPPNEQHYIRVDTRVDVEYPPQVQYIWDTSRISGYEYQQFYGYNPQVGSGVDPSVAGGGPYVGPYYTVQGADGRVYWTRGNPV